MSRSWISHYPDDWYQHGVELYGALTMVERGERQSDFRRHAITSPLSRAYQLGFDSQYGKDFRAAGPYRTPPRQ